jgi:two-component system alkaline phosphatase synthesis response regulator PhoP
MPCAQKWYWLKQNPDCLSMKKILLAEDDPFILDIYSHQFRSEGFTVDIANDGQMALDKLKNEMFDLLVLDIDLPKVNGIEILQNLKNYPLAKRMKIIVLSNYDESGISDKYQVSIESLGVEKYFVKVSITPEEISKAIKEILK